MRKWRYKLFFIVLAVGAALVYFVYSFCQT